MARVEVQSLVDDLGGIAMFVAEDKRVLYHAGLAHGANHLVTLVNQAMDILVEAGAESPATVLKPLLEAALDNALTKGSEALTGPIVRGDVRTVQAHLDDLATSAPASIPAYVAMAKASANKAMLDGRLLGIRGARLISILDHALARYEGRVSTPELNDR